MPQANDACRLQEAAGLVVRCEQDDDKFGDLSVRSPCDLVNASFRLAMSANMHLTTYVFHCIMEKETLNQKKAWTVELCDPFAAEIDDFAEDIQVEILALARLLERFGPELGRPWANTLKGSAYPNMKELRFTTMGGVWRLAYAFDPKRNAVLLVAGDKGGISERRFYKGLIQKADLRFAAHLESISGKGKGR